MNDKLPSTIEELNIKYFKLMNGESIIAYVHDVDTEHGAMVGLEEPMAVLVKGVKDYQFTPWFPFTTGKVHMLDSYNIIAESSVDTHMKAYYMKMVLNGIDTDDDIDVLTHELPDGSTVVH
jgi:hypothetical protein